MSKARYSDLELALMRYCSDHPDAADSVEGVRRWWLADPALPLVDLEAALGTLVARGMLEIRLLPDGTAVYFSRASSVPRS
jgi:hypothetical protein